MKVVMPSWEGGAPEESAPKKMPPAKADATMVREQDRPTLRAVVLVLAKTVTSAPKTATDRLKAGAVSSLVSRKVCWVWGTARSPGPGRATDGKGCSADRVKD